MQAILHLVYEKQDLATKYVDSQYPSSLYIPEKAAIFFQYGNPWKETNVDCFCFSCISALAVYLIMVFN